MDVDASEEEPCMSHSLLSTSLLFQVPHGLLPGQPYLLEGTNTTSNYVQIAAHMSGSLQNWDLGRYFSVGFLSYKIKAGIWRLDKRRDNGILPAHAAP